MFISNEFKTGCWCWYPQLWDVPGRGKAHTHTVLWFLTLWDIQNFLCTGTRTRWAWPQILTTASKLLNLVDISPLKGLQQSLRILAIHTLTAILHFSLAAACWWTHSQHVFIQNINDKENGIKTGNFHYPSSENPVSQAPKSTAR